MTTRPNPLEVTDTAATFTKPSNDTIRDDLVDILDRARDAIQQIESGVDDLNGTMIELIMTKADLPNSEDVEELANNLGAEANELFETLDKHLAELRREIVAKDGDEDNDGEDDEA